MATHTTDMDQSKISVFSGRQHGGMLKPSRRPRPLRPSTKFSEFGPESCDLQINTFYQAPIGQENWTVKHIKLRSQTVVFNKKKQQQQQAAINRQMSRLPPMRPIVKAFPSRFVSDVMKKHYRTQETCQESSMRASREYCLSQDAVIRARETLNEWNEAYEHFQQVCRNQIE